MEQLNSVDTERLSLLYAEAGQLLDTNPHAEQAILLRSAPGHTYRLANRGITGGDTTEADAFLSLLRAQQDLEITHLVCLWRGDSLDVPSMHFRQGLMELSAKNGAALVLLQGEGHLIVKQLNSLMP